MALSQNEIINISSYYVNKYYLTEEDEKNLKEILRQKGNKLLYIFRYISFVKNFLILSRNNKFTIEVPYNSEHIFLRKLQSACFLKVTKRRKVNDEVLVTMDVYY